MNEFKWNPTTALCYKRHMVCKDCPNDKACRIGEQYHKGKCNQYGMRRVKYEVLKTYKMIGLEGIEDYD